MTKLPAALMRPRQLAMLICVWSLLQPALVFACRYNVRDIGFVDQGNDPYMLYGYFRGDSMSDIASRFAEISRAALRDSNIQVEVIDADTQKDHPAMKHLAAPAPATFPAAALVSPDGQSLPVTIYKPGQPFAQVLSAALESIVSSPSREEIVRTVSRAFGAVLLIEGSKAGENDRARKAIAGAIEQIRSQMQWLPKRIAQPPEMIVLSPEFLGRERVLLWSLGLDTEKAGSPRAAVLYGKARWIGPLMKGEEITESNLTGILSIIGADCECGLDISWTQGTRLPARWDETLHAQLVKALGFDPESPMVKIEAGRIVGRRGSSSTPTAIGYQEISVDAQIKEMAAETPGEHVSVPTATAAPRGERIPANPVLAESTPVLRTSLFAVAGLAAVIIATGGLIVLRAARKRNMK